MKRLVIICIVFLLSLNISACEAKKPDVPERYVEVITEYKSNLKDPTSMRIYGDIIVAKFTSDGTIVLSMICDAKNSYGGYGGKDTVEIALMPENDPIFLDSDSEYYFDIRRIYDMQEKTDETYGISEEAREELDKILTFEVIKGEDVASIVDVEYFSA